MSTTTAVVTKFRRLPPLFPAAASPHTLQSSAAWYVEEHFPDLTDSDADTLVDRLVAFAEIETLAEPSHPSDGDKQKACDGRDGHVLTVNGNTINCTACTARWEGVPY